MSRRRLALTIGVASALLGGAAVAAPLASAAVACSDVELVFARGTGDNFPDLLGSVGSRLGRSLTSALPGRSVTATGVNYAAARDQSSAGPGATEMASHLTQVAGQCANTQFVIGGYSQGASVTDIAVGAQGARALGIGDTIPVDLAPRIKAVVVFGNPLSGFAAPLETASDLYGPRTRSFCGRQDGVCGGSRHGNVDGDHFVYPRTPAIITEAAQFAAGRLD